MIVLRQLYLERLAEVASLASQYHGPGSEIDLSDRQSVDGSELPDLLNICRIGAVTRGIFLARDVLTAGDEVVERGMLAARGTRSQR